MTGDFKPFPTAVLDSVEMRLQGLLQSYVYRSEIPRCLLAFLSDKRFLELRPSFITDHRWRIYYASPDSGLIGQAIQTNDIIFWSSDHRWTSEGSDRFSRGDSRTIGEIAAPVSLQGAVTAVLLIDYFEGELLPDQTPTRIKVAKWIRELSDALSSSEKEDSELRTEISNITLQCVKETRSVRGYTALKKWDGTITYLRAGEHVEKFKYLNQLEGICGEVFRKGSFQNIGYVWDHPRYVPSDDRVLSEAVAPIVVNDEVVGVLNLEAMTRDHYGPIDEVKIQEYVKQLVPQALKYRSPNWPHIGIHSRLLSDLIESFSAPNDDLGDFSDHERIEKWAFDLLRRKVMSLEMVQSADLIEAGGSSKLLSDLKEEFEQSIGEIDPYHVHRNGADWNVVFPTLVDGRPRFYLMIVCRDKPNRESLEIVEQFCRLTVNEIRRRVSELSSFEFERLVSSIKSAPWGLVIQEVPQLIARMFNCDYVTYFAASKLGGSTVLIPSSSTAAVLDYRLPERYYRPNVDDGFTGFAATRREVLVIKNAKDKDELSKIHPQLRWRGKIAEESGELPRSFFAMPLWSSGELRGVLRGHRTIKHNKMSLSDRDRKRLELVQFVLESALLQMKEQG